MANLFLDWFAARQQTVTPLKLQKILYFCHADFLVRTGYPLVAEEFEAWRYGPVLPSVYQAFKKSVGCGIRGRATHFDPITLRSSQPVAALDGRYEAIIRPIFDIYAPVDAGCLSAVSHADGGPWCEALRLFGEHRNINRRISSELIRSRHRLLFQ